MVPRLVLDHEVEDGAAPVHPGVEVEGHRSGRHLQEGLGLRDRRLHPLGLSRQLLAGLTDAWGKKMFEIVKSTYYLHTNLHTTMNMITY